MKKEKLNIEGIKIEVDKYDHNDKDEGNLSAGLCPIMYFG